MKWQHGNCWVDVVIFVLSCCRHHAVVLGTILVSIVAAIGSSGGWPDWSWEWPHAKVRGVVWKIRVVGRRAPRSCLGVLVTTGL